MSSCSSCSLSSSPARLCPPQFCRNMLLRHQHPSMSVLFSTSSSSKITFSRLYPVKSHQPPTSPTETPSPDTALLPNNLQDIVVLFQSVQDPKAKYQQLLHYGSRLPPLDARYKTDDYRVRGCVSQVWVRAFLDPENADAVMFEADSDSSLTKGLAALLVLGLSGSSPQAIAGVSPEFVHLLGLRQSLTPSRNNGFLNMLKLMQKKALQFHAHGGDAASATSWVQEDEVADVTRDGPGTNGIGRWTEEEGSNAKVLSSNAEDGVDNVSNSTSVGDGVETVAEDSDGDRNGTSNADGETGGRGERIRKTLEKELAPLELEIEDISYQHAGHVGVAGSRGGETHFNVKVVSKEFEGKSLVKRHRIVYDLLQEELQGGLHALSIVAKTPSEVK